MSAKRPKIVWNSCDYTFVQNALLGNVKVMLDTEGLTHYKVVNTAAVGDRTNLVDFWAAIVVAAVTRKTGLRSLKSRRYPPLCGFDREGNGIVWLPSTI